MRAVVVASAICLSIVGFSAATTRGRIRMPTNIPAQGLGPALKAFCAARDLQVLYFLRRNGICAQPGHRGIDCGRDAHATLEWDRLTYRYVDDKE